MKKLSPIIAILLFLAAPLSGVTAREPQQAAGTFVEMTSDEGLKRLLSSSHKEDFWKLSAHFATQVRQTLCSVATAVTVLNALGVERPIDPVYKPYHYFTQTNYFEKGVSDIRTRELTLTEGMTLQMAAKAMRLHGADTTPHHAEDVTLEKFREMAKENLSTRDNYVVINYQRQLIGQPKGAHFSPLGAYDQASDTFLIMDVARYKFPPVWVRADDLFKAMNTQDSEVSRSRGFILVKRASN